MAHMAVFHHAKERESQLMPITIQAEPEGFFEKVHKPGHEFLVKNPHPKGDREWKKGAYWQKILTELYEAYSGICAYTCHWMPGDTSEITVDHFKPKSKYP